MSEICPKNTTFCYIPGLGGKNPSDFKPEVKNLIESLYTVKCDSKKIIILINKSDYGLKVGDGLKKDIEEIATTQTFCSKHINLVWLAHSHGAVSISEVYKKLMGNKNFQNIKDKSAIICFGGAYLAGKDLAKVVLNIEYKNDYVAKAAGKLLNGREGKVLEIGPLKNGCCQCCDNGDENKEENKGEKHQSVSGKMWGSSVTSASLFCEYKIEGHYLQDYILCRRWKRMLIDLLPLPNGPDSPCIDNKLSYSFALKSSK